jgi:hypothetical protein
LHHDTKNSGAIPTESKQTLIEELDTSNHTMLRLPRISEQANNTQISANKNILFTQRNQSFSISRTNINQNSRAFGSNDHSYIATIGHATFRDAKDSIFTARRSSNKLNDIIATT